MNVLNFQSTVMFMSAVQLYLKRIVLSMCASKEFSIASIAFEFPALDLVYSMINLKKSGALFHGDLFKVVRKLPLYEVRLVSAAHPYLHTTALFLWKFSPLTITFIAPKFTALFWFSASWYSIILSQKAGSHYNYHK